MVGNGGEVIGEGKYVLLYLDQRRKWLVKVSEGKEFHTHKGRVRLGDLVGKPYGCSISSSLGERFLALRPTIYDLIMKAERPTQIMYPKDIGLELLMLGVGPGKRVVEIGTGSGSLTIALANAVRPNGMVFTYEARREFVEIAKRNLSKAGLLDYVTFREADARAGLEERDVDAVTVDIGDPWEVVSLAEEALAGGGCIAIFCPTINQVERTVALLAEGRFADIETYECLLREILVRPGRTRPATRMIGHTGYLTFARKVLERGAPPPDRH
ncbi:MAG: tRNA (adenine-N1)-methyltransferase [Candidatus Bathyarchaeia archaeon]